MPRVNRKPAADKSEDAWPVNRHAEEVVLGNALQNWAEVRERIGPDLFWDKANRRILSTMLDLDERGEPVDSLTVSQQLQRNGLNEGDIGILVQLGGVPILGAALDPYLRSLDRTRRLRALAIGGEKIKTAAMIDGADPDAI